MIIEPYMLRVPLEQEPDAPAGLPPAAPVRMTDVPVLIPYEVADGITSCNPAQAARSFGGREGELEAFWKWHRDSGWPAAGGPGWPAAGGGPGWPAAGGPGWPAAAGDLGWPAAGAHPAAQRVPEADLKKLLPIVVFYDGVDYLRDSEWLVWCWSSLLAQGDTWQTRFHIGSMPVWRITLPETMAAVHKEVAKFIAWALQVTRNASYMECGQRAGETGRAGGGRLG